MTVGRLNAWLWITGFFGTMSVGQKLPMGPLEFLAMWCLITMMTSAAIATLAMLTRPDEE